MNIELLESSFAVLEDQLDELARRFYEKMFSQYPEVVPLFKNTMPDTQRRKLATALQLVVSSLRKPEELMPVIHRMGERHVHYGVKEEHYPIVVNTLPSVMQEMAGDQWTDEIGQAWTEALSLIAATMLEEYQNIEETEDEH